MMNVSKHESGVITNGDKDAIDILYSVFHCYPKCDTNEDNCYCFTIYEIDLLTVN